MVVSSVVSGKEKAPEREPRNSLLPVALIERITTTSEEVASLKFPTDIEVSEQLNAYINCVRDACEATGFSPGYVNLLVGSEDLPDRRLIPGVERLRELKQGYLRMVRERAR
jgi:hypothetical protein